MYFGAKLPNTGEVLREDSSEVNNTLPVVLAAVKKVFEMLSIALGLLAGWRIGHKITHRCFLTCVPCFLTAPSCMASSSLLLRTAVQTPESMGPWHSLLYLFTCKQLLAAFSLTLLLCLIVSVLS